MRGLRLVLTGFSFIFLGSIASRTFEAGDPVTGTLAVFVMICMGAAAIITEVDG